MQFQICSTRKFTLISIVENSIHTGEIIAHASSVSAMSESMSVTKKLLETMMRVKQKIFLQAVNI